MVDSIGLLFLIAAAGQLPSGPEPAATVRPPRSTEEQPADAQLQAWTRAYRACVDETFAHEPDERGRRRAELDNVLSAWHGAGTPAEGREKLLAWLQAATGASTPGSRKPLPEPPRFDSDPVTIRIIESRPPPSSERPVVAPPSASEASAPNVGVNLRELAAQIAGYNLALRALEAQLDAERQGKAKTLSGPVDRFLRLAAKRDDCRLVAGLLSPRDRPFVGELEPLGPALGRLERRVDAATDRAMGPNFVGTARDRMIELRELDRMSRTLSELHPAP